MTPEQQAAYQADVDRVVADLRLPEARGRVREFCGWTDEETGEEFPPHWVAEVRLGRGAGSPIIVLDIGEPEDNREDWIDLLHGELAAARVAWRRRQRQETAQGEVITITAEELPPGADRCPACRVTHSFHRLLCLGFMRYASQRPDVLRDAHADYHRRKRHQ